VWEVQGRPAGMWWEVQGRLVGERDVGIDFYPFVGRAVEGSILPSSVYIGSARGALDVDVG
jgi:hypothetical protein